MALLCLVTALSVLQWTTPTVDPWLFARIGHGTPQEARLTAAEPQFPAVEARAPSTTAAYDKRAPNGRSPACADDTAAAVPELPPALPAGRTAAASAAAADGPRAHDGHGFTARGPPRAG